MDQSVRDAYEATWSRRRTPPIITDNWVDNDWAKGRTDYLTFLIRIEDKNISKDVSKLQELLSEYPCLDPFPPEYLHVTVKEVSCFLVESDPADDELTGEQVSQLVDEAVAALKDMKSFEVKIEKVNHFRSNIVVEAHDDGSIREMNRRLMKLKGVKRLAYDYPKFLPHMSVCQFKNDTGHDKIVDTLEGVRDRIIGSFPVKHVDLVKAVLPKKGRYPVLENLHRFNLS